LSAHLAITGYLVRARSIIISREDAGVA